MVGRSPCLPRADPHLAVYVISRPLCEARQPKMIACMKSGQVDEPSAEGIFYYLCGVGLLELEHPAKWRSAEVQKCRSAEVQGSFKAVSLAKSLLES